MVAAHVELLGDVVSHDGRSRGGKGEEAWHVQVLAKLRDAPIAGPTADRGREASKRRVSAQVDAERRLCRVLGRVKMASCAQVVSP